MGFVQLTVLGMDGHKAQKRQQVRGATTSSTTADRSATFCLGNAEARKTRRERYVENRYHPIP